MTALSALAGLLAFRCLPFAAWAALGMRGRQSSRLVLLALPFAAVALRCSLDAGYPRALLLTALGLLYCTLACVGLHQASGAVRLPAPLAFAFVCGVFLVVPGLIFPFGSATLPLMIALGWELSLAAYSYYLEAPRQPRVSLASCLFFLLVNPEVVFPSRATPAPARHWQGLGRFVWGTLVMALVMVVAPRWTQAPAALSSTPIWEGLWSGARTLCWVYAAHSALAHMQIGLCLATGYRIPERYRYPLLARSPADFWGRWNRYVGAWLRIYVYAPAFRAARKRCGALASHWSATLCAFAAVGVMHDGCVYLQSGALSLRMTAGFLLWAVALAGVQQLEAGTRPNARGRRVRAVLGPALLLPALSFTLWVFY